MDFACIVDGKVYVGEAKSNAIVDRDQFRFYEELALNSSIDGLVLATTEAQWNRSVVARAQSLKAMYKGEVLLLTQTELLSMTD